MINKVLLHDQLSYRKKIKAFLIYVNRLRGVKRSWRKRHSKVFENIGDYKSDKQLLKEYRKFWSKIRRNIETDTLEVCKEISQIKDLRFIPEDVYAIDIEPTLNKYCDSEFYQLKNFYEKWHKGSFFPKSYIHKMEGLYYDSDFQPLSLDMLKKKALDLDYPLVVKPSRDTFGGRGVTFPQNVDDLIKHLSRYQNMIVQEKIEQHPFFRDYNSAGINTIRVCVYKSILTKKCHVLNAALRMGVGGSLDNETDGGIVSFIDADGILNDYAVDKYGKIFNEHPDSGQTFEKKIPLYDEMLKLSKTISQNIYFLNLLSLDLVLDKSKQWKVIEVNTKSQTIRFSQYGGHPFFGEFTQEVIDYTVKNHWIFDD